MNRGYPLTLGAMIRRAFREYPDNVAIISGRQHITFRQFHVRVNRTAHALAALGAKTGDRIALLMSNCPEFLEVEFAALMSGMSRVGLNARLHPKDHAYIINDCGASILFVGEEFAEHVAGIRDELRFVKEIVCVGKSATGMLNYEQVMAEQPADEIYVDVDQDEPAIFLYTSGTTGRPKGATLSHRNWIACMRNIMIELPPIREGDVMLHVAPLTHASGCLVIPHFSRGAANLTFPTFDAPLLLEMLQRERVTTAFLVPTMINLLAAYSDVRNYDLSSLQTIVYAGSPIAGEKLRQSVRVFGQIFMQFYGLSETPMPISCLRKEDSVVEGSTEQLARLASAGRPVPFVEVKLVDEEGNEVPTGEMGEVCTRGDHVMNGYWNLPEATEAMIDEQGWAHTGDLAKMDDAGYLYIVDRKSDMIISGGFNVYPREIEEVIYTHPAVLEAAVIGVPDDKWGEAVKAIIVLKEGATATAEEITQMCRASLAGYKKPQSVEFVESIPKNATGKMLKKQLRERYWVGYARRVHG